MFISRVNHGSVALQRSVSPVRPHPLSQDAPVKFGAQASVWKSLFTAASLAVMGMSAGVIAPVLAQEKQPAAPAVQVTTPDEAPPKLDVEELDKKLQSTGLEGYLHAADPDSRLYVFTYRNPENFFDSVEFSIIGLNKNINDVLKTLSRHDKVLIKGRVKSLANPQPHIIPKSIDVVKRWTPSERPEKKRVKTAKLPDELREQNVASFMVHAVVKDGKVIVLEYKDSIVLMVVPDRSFTENVSRGDRVKVRYELNDWPQKPTHITLDTDTSEGKKPIEVTDRLMEMDGKENYTQEGRLVLFLKNDTVIGRDFWAVEQKPEDGSPSRYFTLTSFTDAKARKAIDEQLRKWWQDSKGKVVDARNKLAKTGLSIRVTGTVHITGPQASITPDTLELVTPPAQDAK